MYYCYMYSSHHPSMITFVNRIIQIHFHKCIKQQTLVLMMETKVPIEL